MNINHFDLNLLVALDALLTERNVTRAAEKLCVTQPALSGSLQRLRQQFEDPILVRIGRNMELTPKATALVEPVREALRRVRGVLDTHQSFEPVSSQRTFRLSMSDYCYNVFWPHMTRELMAKTRNITSVIEPFSIPSFEQLEGGDIDFVITHRDPGFFDPHDVRPELNAEYLFADDFVCAVAENHPAGKSLSIDDYLRYPHVLAYFGAHSYTLEEDLLQKKGVRIDRRLFVPSLSALVYHVPGTDLIATVPRRLAQLIAPSLPVRLLESPVEVGPVEETLFWHRRNDSDPGHCWLRNQIARIGKSFENARELSEVR